MIIVEQGCVWRLGFSCHRVIGRARDQVNIQPAVVIVIKKADPGTDGLQNKFLLGRTHDVPPLCKSGLFSDILKNNGPAVDKSASGDRALLFIKNRRIDSGRGYASLRLRWRRR